MGGIATRQSLSMRLIASLLLGATFALPVQAAPVLCAGNPALRSLEGAWALPGFLDQLRRTRSFSAAQAAVDDQHAVVYVEDRRVYFNLAWHEGGEGNACVRVQGDALLVGDVSGDGRPVQWYGPYARTGSQGRADEDDSAYLRPFFAGCWRSERAETWCLSPSGITVDGKRVDAELVKDASERPGYGTVFRTHLTALPFTVFVPLADGWAVFQDDWVTSEHRKPVDPVHDAPWRRLRPR